MFEEMVVREWRSQLFEPSESLVLGWARKARKNPEK